MNSPDGNTTSSGQLVHSRKVFDALRVRSDSVERTWDGWRVEKHDAFSLPLYVRANTLLAFGNVADRPDYDYVEGTTYRVYALEDGKAARCAVVSRDGATMGHVSARRAVAAFLCRRRGSRRRPF